MTDEELKNLIGSLAESHKETERKFQETEQQMKETDRRFQETERQIKENDVRMNEKLDKLSKLVGGISANNGYFAEDLFISALQKNTSLGNIKFNAVIPRVTGFNSEGENREYDIVLTNGIALGVVEVKYRLHPDDVVKFATKSLSQFRTYFPQFAGKKIYGAVAGTSIPRESLEKAKEYGLAVLSAEGPEVKILNDVVKEY